MGSTYYDDDRYDKYSTEQLLEELLEKIVEKIEEPS